MAPISINLDKLMQNDEKGIEAVTMCKSTFLVCLGNQDFSNGPVQ